MEQPSMQTPSLEALYQALRYSDSRAGPRSYLPREREAEGFGRSIVAEE
jgi:hypothetical protein